MDKVVSYDDNDNDDNGDDDNENDDNGDNDYNDNDDNDGNDDNDDNDDKNKSLTKGNFHVKKSFLFLKVFKQMFTDLKGRHQKKL